MRSGCKSNSKPAAKTLPRRCAVIRRTYPEEGVQKTELRFVSYKSLTDELDEKGFFEEVRQFLKEQVEDIDKGTHHKAVCANGSFLKKSIPHLEYLSRYYGQLAKQTKDVQYQILKMSAEEVLVDVQKALMEGGYVGNELLNRLEMLTKIPVSSDSDY